MTTYFLSYARTDQQVALRFADDLIEAGVSVWVDQYDILPSQHWDQAVETALRGCRGMLVMLSPASVASPNVADEVAVAIDSGKQVVPVLIEPCILPLRMTRMQFIDACSDYQTALRRCLSFVREQTDPLARRDRKMTTPVLRLEPEVLKTAERRLTSFMGPIAARLVATAAVEAATSAELYARLAESIHSEAERRTFLHWIAEPAGGARVVTPRQPPPEASNPLTPDELQAIAKALTRYLGPIAARLVEREKAFAASRIDLCRRLAERVSQEAERAAFLKDVDAA